MISRYGPVLGQAFPASDKMGLGTSHHRLQSQKSGYMFCGYIYMAVFCVYWFWWPLLMHQWTLVISTMQEDRKMPPFTDCMIAHSVYVGS
jgi:hypothetical protein